MNIQSTNTTLVLFGKFKESVMEIFDESYLREIFRIVKNMKKYLIHIDRVDLVNCDVSRIVHNNWT